MRKAFDWMFIAFLIVATCSCRHRMSSHEYVNYVTGANGGLKKTIVVDGFEFSIQYRPYDYILLTESKGDFTNYDYGKRLASLKGAAWFSIAVKREDERISPLRYGVSSLEDYNKRLDYFLNKAKDDIWLVYGNTTIYPMSYLFENNYNLTPQETMMVGFLLPAGDDRPRQDMQLSFNDEVFKSGIVKATYTRNDLEGVPNLVY